MSWIKRISLGIKIVFGKTIEVKPTVGVGIDNSEINKLLNEARELVNEGGRNRDREGAEDDQDKG